MSIEPNQTVIIDGMFSGEVVQVGVAGVHSVRILGAPQANIEPHIVQAVWDGETRAAATGEPLMVTIDAAE